MPQTKPPGIELDPFKFAKWDEKTGMLLDRKGSKSVELSSRCKSIEDETIAEIEW